MIPFLFLPWALGCGRSIPGDLLALTVQVARTHAIPEEILVALVWIESRFCPQVVGKKGEIGLGQVLPATAWGVGVHPNWLRHPEANLVASARYLRQMYHRFGNWPTALAAYNAGPGRALSPPYSTRIYVRNVLYVARYLRSQGIGEKP